MKKEEHIKYALECEGENSLDSVRLKYYSILNLSVDNIDISTEFCNMKFKYPIYINAMTGGCDKADDINKRLYNICTKLDIFMFSGSYTPNLEINKYYYPKNMGVNLGADKKLDDFKKAILETKAKILQIHLNPIQELFMYDGDKSFNYEENIKKAVESITIPIILKETGYGVNEETIRKAINLGIKTIDISSRGGTNFTYIEDKRANKKRQYLYDLGYTLKESLISSFKYQDKIEILASGGIKTPLDVVKALSMGAVSVGISSYILKLIYEYENDEEIINILKEFIYEIKLIMATTNSKKIKDLKGKFFIKEEK